MSRPIFSLPDDERRRLVQWHRGELVSLDVDGLRNGEVQTFEGELVAVARPITGAQTAAAIIRTDDGEEFSISLATIRNLFPMKPKEPTR